MTADAFTLGRDERRRLLPRRLDHDPRGVSGLVIRAFRHEIDSVVVVARPRRVAAPERVERRRRDGVAPRLAVRARLNDVVAAGRQRDLERDRLARRRHVPRPGRHFLAFGVPRVEPVAFGAPDARPLDLRERDVDLHAGNRRTIEADGDEFSLEPVLLLDEVRRPANADVPRRGVHDDARAVRDVLARNVLDVPFEGV